MTKDFIKPDYERCNLNISATLAEFLGAPNRNAVLPELKKELGKDFKNVVFICFDGLGMHPMRVNLGENDFLMKNVRDILTSTFPSTTTNATTSLLTNRLPLEHGWFGWSMNFEAVGRNIDIFSGRDSWNGEPAETGESPLGALDYYFDHSACDYAINTVFPKYVKVAHPERNNVFRGADAFFGKIRGICERYGKQFVYAYYPEPDTTMHKYGVSSSEALNVITGISNRVRDLYHKTKNTLFIITADHGQIDVSECIRLYEDRELLDTLEIYPYMEARAACFRVKDGRDAEFEKLFNEKYGEDFTLLRSDYLIKNGYFGNYGDKADLLGDYIAVGGYGHKMFSLTPTIPDDFKGHHTSLTEEMKVPLILLEN